MIPGQSRPLYQYSLDRKRPMHTYSCEQNAQILLRLEKERLKKYGSSGRLPVSKYWTTNIRAFLALTKKLFGVENCVQLVLSQLSIQTKTNIIVIQVRERENEITKCKSLQKSTSRSSLNFKYSKLLQLVLEFVTLMCDLMNAWMASNHRPNLSCILCWMSQHLYILNHVAEDGAGRTLNPMFTNFQR